MPLVGSHKMWSLKIWNCPYGFSLEDLRECSLNSSRLKYIVACTNVIVDFLWFVCCSKLRPALDDLEGADTSSSDSRHWKVTLAKTVHLLNELATMLSELSEADPAYEYTRAANEKT